MSKDGIIAYLGQGTVYSGKLSFVGAVRIDGQFTGEINSDGTLILGNDAFVKGEINVNQLVLSGKLQGDVVVSGKTIMHKTAKLQGNLTTKQLIMEEGALLQGNVGMHLKTENALETAPQAESGKSGEPPMFTVVRGAQS